MPYSHTPYLPTKICALCQVVLGIRQCTERPQNQNETKNRHLGIVRSHIYHLGHNYIEASSAQISIYLSRQLSLGLINVVAHGSIHLDAVAPVPVSRFKVPRVEGRRALCREIRIGMDWDGLGTCFTLW